MNRLSRKTIADRMKMRMLENLAASRMRSRGTLDDRLRELSAAMGKKAPKAKKLKEKRAPSKDIDLRREYYKYQDIKSVFVGANMILAWVSDFFVSSDIHPYIYNDKSQFSMVNEPSKEMLEQFAIHSKKLRMSAPKREKDKDRDYTTDERIKKGSVLVRIEIPELNFNINPTRAVSAFAYGSEAEKSKREALVNFNESLKTFDTQMGALFGAEKFRFGRTFKLETSKLGSRRIVCNMKMHSSPAYKFSEFGSSGSGSKSFTSMVAKAAGIGTVVENKNMPPEDYRNMMEFQLSVDDSSCYVVTQQHDIDKLLADSTLASKLTEGTLTLEELASVCTPLMSFKMGVEVFIRYPLKYAMWATCCESVDQFNAPLFVDLHNTRVMRSTSMQTKGLSRTPTWMSGMNQVRDDVRNYEKTFEHTFKPRTNEDGFALTKSANPIYVPDVDNTDEYMSKMKTRYDRETHMVMTPEQVGLRNFPVFSDWKNNKFAYCNTSGDLEIYDLSGASPMPAAFIFRSLDQLFSNEKSYAGRFLFEWSRKLDMDGKIFKEVTDEIKKLVGEDVAWRGSQTFSDLYNALRTRESMITKKFHDIFGPWDDADKLEITGFSRSRDKHLYYMIDVLRAGVWKLLKVITDPKLTHDIALKNVIEWARFGGFVLTKYAKNGEEIANEAKKLRESNKLNDVDTEGYVPQIANLGGLEYLQPHQTVIAGALDAKDPKYAIIDVSAGGGKTITCIEDILRLLRKGKIKRALVITKDNLVSEFRSEAERTGKGDLNLVPITSQTIEQHIRNFDFDAKKFVKWMKSFPPNTIFVAGYNFMKKGDWSDENLTLFKDENRAIVRNRNEIVYGNYIGPPTSEMIAGVRCTSFKPLETFPMADLMILCGFDYVAVDEAHYIKETSAQVTQAVNNVMATASYRRWLSGTIVTNTALDLVGITSTLGVLGDKDTFKKNYMNGLNLKPGAADEIFERIGERMAIITKRRKDWAYIMPNISEEILGAPMTPTQEKFYENLLKQAMTQFEKDYDDILGTKKKKKGDEEGEEDDETSERIEQALIASLGRLEVFMGAPDEDKPRGKASLETGVDNLDSFMNIIPKPSPEDMVSPKVKILNQVLNAHFFGIPFRDIEMDTSVGADGAPTHKVLVLSYNKPLSRHIMKHLSPELKKMALRYVASPTEDDAGLDLLPGKQALEQFRRDKRIKILVADVASMTEGYNLQMASRLVEMQTVWSPGKMEQARARVLRPDPRGMFNRDSVNVTVIATTTKNHDVASVDYVKFARMITKIISKARLDYSKDRSWMRHMANNPKLELPGGGLKMSPKSIAEMKPSDFIPYQEAYMEFITWEQEQFHQSRLLLQKKTEARLGRPVSMSELKTLALIKIDHEKPLAGSRRVFTPFIYGMEIYDPLGLNLKSILQYNADSVKYDDDGELDETDDSDVTKVEEGTPVWTQYGPGRIVGKPRTKSIRVAVPGLGEVTVTKGVAFIPKDPEGLRRFNRLLDLLGATGAPTVNRDGLPITQRDLTGLNLDAKTPIKKNDIVKPMKPTKDLEEDEDDDEINDDDTDSEVEDGEMEVSVLPRIVNGAPALLFIGDKDGDPEPRDRFLAEFGKYFWRQVPDFIGIKVANFRVMKAWRDRLAEKYAIKSERLDYLTDVAGQLQNKSGKLIVEDEHLTSLKAFKNFYDLSHRDLPKAKPGKLKTVKPWLITFSNSAYIAFDARSHHPQLLQELRSMFRGISKKHAAAIDPKLFDYWAIKFVSGVADAKNLINKIEDSPKFSVIEYDETIEEAKKLRNIRKKPTAAPTKKVTKKKMGGKPSDKKPGKPGTKVVKKLNKLGKVSSKPGNKKPGMGNRK